MKMKYTEPLNGTAHAVPVDNDVTSGSSCTRRPDFGVYERYIKMNRQRAVVQKNKIK